MRTSKPIREKSFKLYLLDNEYEILQEKSIKKGITKSGVLRELILNLKYENMMDKITENNALNKEMIAQLQKIGNNINQIAYQVNIHLRTNSSDASLIEQMKDFRQLISEFSSYIAENKLGKVFKQSKKKGTNNE